MDNLLKLLICFSFSFCLKFSEGKNSNTSLSNFQFLIKPPETTAIFQDSVILKTKRNLKILSIKSIKNAYLINALDTSDKSLYTIISVKEKNKKGIKIKKNNFYLMEIIYYTPYRPNFTVIGDRLRYYKIRDKLIYISNKYIVWEPVAAENLDGLYYSCPMQVPR